MGPYTVTIVSVLALAVWSAVLAFVWGDLLHDRPLPLPVQEAAIVALFSVLILAIPASLGFADVLDGNISAVFGGAWIAAVLSSGVYALVAVAKLRRRER